MGAWKRVPDRGQCFKLRPEGQIGVGWVRRREERWGEMAGDQTSRTRKHLRASEERGEGKAAEREKEEIERRSVGDFVKAGPSRGSQAALRTWFLFIGGT